MGEFWNYRRKMFIKNYTLYVVHLGHRGTYKAPWAALETMEKGQNNFPHFLFFFFLLFLLLLSSSSHPYSLFSRWSSSSRSGSSKIKSCGSCGPTVLPKHSILCLLALKKPFPGTSEAWPFPWPFWSCLDRLSCCHSLHNQPSKVGV